MKNSCDYLLQLHNAVVKQLSSEVVSGLRHCNRSERAKRQSHKYADNHGECSTSDNDKDDDAADDDDDCDFANEDDGYYFDDDFSVCPLSLSDIPDRRPEDVAATGIGSSRAAGHYSDDEMAPRRSRSAADFAADDRDLDRQRDRCPPEGKVRDQCPECGRDFGTVTHDSGKDCKSSESIEGRGGQACVDDGKRKQARCRKEARPCNDKAPARRRCSDRQQKVGGRERRRGRREACDCDATLDVRRDERCKRVHDDDDDDDAEADCSDHPSVDSEEYSRHKARPQRCGDRKQVRYIDNYHHESFVK